MKLENEFTVPVPVEEAWKVLLDVERVAPCMPGATLLTVDGDSFTGSVKVKVGPIQVTYKGSARFAAKDDTEHRAVIEASGKEARGSGTAAATVTTVLVDAGGTTRVKVESDLNVTGRPAQFGRGVMSEVAAKLIGQFATCLAEELAGGPAGQSPAAASDATTALAAPAAPVADAADAAARSTARRLAPQQRREPADGAAGAPAQEAATTAGTTAPDAATTAGPAATAPLRPVQPGASAGAPRDVSPAPRRSAEAIDLLDVAGASVAKRLAPVAAVVALLLLLFWRRRHRD